MTETDVTINQAPAASRPRGELFDAFESCARTVRAANRELDILLAPVAESDGFSPDEYRFYLFAWNQILHSPGMTHYMQEASKASHAGRFWLGVPILVSVERLVERSTETLRSLNQLESVRGDADRLGNLLESALSQAGESFFHSSNDEFNDFVMERIESAADSLMQHRSVSSMKERAAVELDAIKGLKVEAEDVLDARKDVTAHEGEVELSKHYAELAGVESAQANVFRRYAVGTLIVAVSATTFFVGVQLVDAHLLISPTTDYVSFLQRLAFLAGLFGLAGYLARQAHQHRSMANWAGALAVQLKTFNAYIAPVRDQEAKDQLRKDFAARVFGDHPAMKGEPSLTPSAAAMDSAMDYAAKLVGIGKSGGNP